MRNGPLLIALLLTGCGLTKDLNPSNQAVLRGSAGGKAAFAKTLLAAMRSDSKCSNCHTSNGAQSGRPFADSVLEVAYPAALANELVDFESPGASRVVTYLANNHCNSLECNVTDPSMIAKISKAASDWAQAELAASPGPSPSPVPANSLSTLPGAYTDPVQIPASVPSSDQAPLLFAIPLSRLGAAFAGSSLVFSISTIVSMSDGTGATIYLYQFTNPTLVNGGATTLSVAGLDVGLDGLFDPQNRIFSDATADRATAAAGQRVALNPTDPQRAMIFWGHSGPNLNQIAVNFATISP